MFVTPMIVSSMFFLLSVCPQSQGRALESPKLQWKKIASKKDVQEQLKRLEGWLRPKLRVRVSKEVTASHNVRDELRLITEAVLVEAKLGDQDNLRSLVDLFQKDFVESTTWSGHKQINYHLPLALLAAEYAFSVRPKKAMSPKGGDDRGIRARPMLTTEQQKAVVGRLARLLSKTSSLSSFEFDKLQRDKLFDYTSMGINVTDISVTGMAALGIQAAIDLGVLEFPKEAFKDVPAGNNLEEKKAILLFRLNDCLTHLLLTLSGQRGSHPFLKMDSRTEVPDPRTFHELKLIHGDDPLVASLKETKTKLRELVYFYNGDGQQTKGTVYFVASGGYALWVASAFWRRSLEAARKCGKCPAGYKRTYEIQETKGKEHVISVVGESQGSWRIGHKESPYSKLTIHSGSGEEEHLSVSSLIARALGTVIHGKSTLIDKDMPFHFKGDKYGGYNAFAIAKFLLATGHADVCCGVTWHQQLCRREVAEDDANRIGLWFVLIIGRAYRPLFSLGGR